MNSTRHASCFIAVTDESQQMEGEKLAQELRENGISLQGVDVLTAAKEAVNSTEFLETVRRESVPKIKRPFRGVLAR